MNVNYNIRKNSVVYVVETAGRLLDYEIHDLKGQAGHDMGYSLSKNCTRVYSTYSPEIPEVYYKELGRNDKALQTLRKMEQSIPLRLAAYSVLNASDTSTKNRAIDELRSSFKLFCTVNHVEMEG